MKKTLILAGIITLLATSSATYATTAKAEPQAKPSNVEKQKVCDKKDFKKQIQNIDERLKLTEEQKAKAHELRMKGHEKIKPVVQKIKAKHEEIKTIIENPALTQEQKDKKIYNAEKELLKLKQEARKIRTQNMKEFEAILTDEQKAEFENIKKEAQAMHQKGHRGHKGPHGEPDRAGINPPQKPAPIKK